MTSKIIFSGLVTVLITFISYSQKIKIQSGNTNFLKDQTNINVQFDYTGVTFYSKKISEKEYISNRSDEIKEKNTEEDWTDTWQEFKEITFPEKFLTSANKYSENKLVFNQNIKTKYTLIVKTDWIKPGAPMWSYAQLNTTLKFIDSENPSKVLLTIICRKAPGKSFVPHRNTIISESYAMTGKLLALLLNKKE